MRNRYPNLGFSPEPDDPADADALTAFARRAYSQKAQERATLPLVQAARTALLGGGAADTRYEAPRATPTRPDFLQAASFGPPATEDLPREWTGGASVIPWGEVSDQASLMGIDPQELLARLQRAGHAVSGFPGYGPAQAPAE